MKSSSKQWSAFAVFKGKKDKPESDNDVDVTLKKKVSIRKSSSTPAINTDSAPASKGKTKDAKALLKVLKGGSLRGSLRTTPKSRPCIIPPPVVSEQHPVTLTKIQSKKTPERFLESGSKNKKSEKLQTKPNKQSPVQTNIAKPPLSDVMRNGASHEAIELTLNTETEEAFVRKQSLMKKSRKMSSSEKLKTRQLTPVSMTKRKSSVEADSKEIKRVKTDDEEIPSTELIDPSLMYDSSVVAEDVFSRLIQPVTVEKFFSELWERKPLLVKRHMPTYNDGWFSTAEMDKILRENNLNFSQNIDVVTYENGKRETHNPGGRAYAPVIWDYYQNGCSVRLLNPQTYSKNVWKLLSLLQEYFGCMVGANIYLTPPNTQGFAPHWDDIEAFVIQLEGKKHWKLYNPRSENETLPRFSSDNFTEMDCGAHILNVSLEAGDIMYFPRGFIHQGYTEDDTHSLHITVSCYQRNTWGDLMNKLLPRALDVAIEEDVEFRKGLPRGYLNYMGVVHSDKSSPERSAFLQQIEHLMTRMLGSLPVDAVCDQMGKQFIQDSLPPMLSEEEKACSIHGSGERWDKKKSSVVNRVEIEPDTAVKIIRKGAIRLVSEEESVRVYHCLDNARVYHGHGEEPMAIEIPSESAEAVEYLINSYPQYVTVDELPLENVDEKVSVATLLYESGLLITGDPLIPLDEESSSDEEQRDNAS